MPAAGYAYALILDTCKIKLQAMATLRDAVRVACFHEVVRQSQLLETLRVACNSCGVRLTHILLKH